MEHRAITSSTFGPNPRIHQGDVFNNNYYYDQPATNSYHVQFAETKDSIRGLILCDLPSKTRCFFGREKELSQMRSTVLETKGTEQKGVSLCGISGSGKTQTALELIEREKDNFSAILWIDASSVMSVEDSFASCASGICREFSPSDARTSARSLVLHWMRSTRYKNWLLVVDSLDDLVANRELFTQINDLPCGRLCFTSTNEGLARQARVEPLVLPKLDLLSSQSLLLWHAMEGRGAPSDKSE